MSLTLYNPLVDNEAAPAEDGTFGAAAPRLLPDLKNLAGDAKIAKLIQDEVIPILEAGRQDRVVLEEEWNAIRRLSELQHDSGQRYKGRSNAYLPIYARVQQTLISSLSNGLFPSDEYLDVADRGETDQANAKAVKTYLQWEFERVGRVRANVKPFLRQFVDFGTAVLKFWYRKETRPQIRRTKLASLLGPGAAGSVPSFALRPWMEGLAVSARPLHNWYMWPTTAESLEAASCVWEDTLISRAEIEQYKAKKVWANVDEAMTAEVPFNLRSNTAQQMQDKTGMISPLSKFIGSSYGDLHVATEVWCMLPLPASEYMPDETVGEPVPCRVVLLRHTPVLVTRNPHWHQRPPYLVGRQNVEPGVFYGVGQGRLVRYLQYLANDFANQGNDAANYILNPLIKANPGMLAMPLTPMAPGATWYFTDIQAGVAFERPPTEIINASQAMTQQWISFGQDFGGAPPVLQGTGSKGGAKTATGAQILQKNALSPLQDTVEDLELDVMVPLMWGTWVNAQQWRDSAVMAQVGGGLQKVDPEQLVMTDPEFRYLASSQAANSQARNQQLLQLVQGVMPLVPLLNQLGYIVDPAPLLRRIYSDGMGFRGFDEFLKQGQAMGMLQQAGSPMAAQAATGDRVRSALEQVTGAEGAPEMAPGEGDEFMDMRQAADQMAGDMGGFGGGGEG